MCNTMESLINCLYSKLLAQDEYLSDEYFLNCIILGPRSGRVHEVNSTILDFVMKGKYNYIQPKILNTFSSSGFPLHKLEFKIGVLLMLLHNLNLINGLCTSICLRLLRPTCHILECSVLHGNNVNNVVFIPGMALDSGFQDSSIPLCCLQFSFHLAYAMIINTLHRMQMSG